MPLPGGRCYDRLAFGPGDILAASCGGLVHMLDAASGDLLDAIPDAHDGAGGVAAMQRRRAGGGAGDVRARQARAAVACAAVITLLAAWGRARGRLLAHGRAAAAAATCARACSCGCCDLCMGVQLRLLRPAHGRAAAAAATCAWACGCCDLCMGVQLRLLCAMAVAQADRRARTCLCALTLDTDAGTGHASHRPHAGAWAWTWACIRAWSESESEPQGADPQRVCPVLSAARQRGIGHTLGVHTPGVGVTGSGPSEVCVCNTGIGAVSSSMDGNAYRGVDVARALCRPVASFVLQQPGSCQSERFLQLSKAGADRFLHLSNS
eukprot:365987-Chlamydomonas_euryale.AAC.15